MEEKKITTFAELILRLGVNVQKGQPVLINCPVEKAEIGRIFAEKAYEVGASYVKIKYGDEKLARINYLHAAEEVLCDVPPSAVAEKLELLERGYCYVSIVAEDPNILKGLDEKKIANVNKAFSKANKKFHDGVMNNAIRWCVVSVPSEAWAKEVFPDADDPQETLWEAIAKSVRLYAADPVEEWKKHIATLNRRAEFLNENDFDYLHYTSANGTDLKVGLAENHRWLAAEEVGQDGVKFIANMPTEEVFTAPHRLRVDGVVKNALPLVENGNVIDGFSLTFKEGKVADFSAEKGYETLKGILETDEGATHIGEVALIGKNSTIAQSKTLFYNTLFDENASCHLALGKAYPTTIFGGDKMSEEELKAHGANDSLTHVDFMIGTEDLSVTGVKKNGEKVELFKDGEWTI